MSKQGARQPRTRGTRIYAKPALATDDLLSRLTDRGLDLPDRDRAARYLRQIGYYRLSPYAIPFRSTGDQFRPGTSFDDLLGLYVFDRHLRLLVTDAIERAEVALRASLTDHMATKYANPHWYTDQTLFRDAQSHKRFLNMVVKTCRDRLNGPAERDNGSLHHQSALEHYLMTYEQPELPPCWVMIETLTLGQLSSVYENLKVRADRTEIAKGLGLNDALLKSWMRSYVRVRNISAHHGRLWNVGLGVYPMIPRDPSVSWLRGIDALPKRSQKRLYPVLVSLQSILDTISPKSGWPRRLHSLASEAPELNRQGMGIPENWAQDPFWSKHIQPHQPDEALTQP